MTSVRNSLINLQPLRDGGRAIFKGVGMPVSHEDEHERIGDDLLRGLAEISAFIDENELRTGYLIKQGLIPAGKLGRMYIASKRRLRQRYMEITRGAVDTAA